MKILITGGAGFIGSNLAKRLLDRGYEVVVVDNLITGRKENIAAYLRLPNFKFYHCSIESEEFKQLFDKTRIRFDEIYHLACPTGVPNIDKLGDEMLSACSSGTLNVLNLAAEMEAKFLFTSSSEIYGEPLVSPQSESYTGNVSTLGERANYEEGKRFSETLVQRFVRSRGLKATIVRFFNVYGPNMSLHDSRVVSRFAAQALTGKPLTVQGDGSQRRTFCYISEIVNGLELVMSKGEIGKVYNLGSDKEISMHSLAELIIEMTGSSSRIAFVERPDHDHSSRLPDLEEIRSLGWEDKIALREGIGMALEYFKDELKGEVQGEILDEQMFAPTSIKPKEAYS